jgi:hypothetical protein
VSIRGLLPFRGNPRLHLLQGFRLQRLEAPECGVLRLKRFKPALAEKILVVEPQLFEARPRHLRELEFGLFRGRGSRGTLRDILHAAPGGLNHLVAGAAALFDVLVAKAHGNVIGELRHLKALQPAVPAMLRNERFVVIHGQPQKSVHYQSLFVRVRPGLSAVSDRRYASRMMIPALA